MSGDLVFVDTNVLLYMRDSTEPDKQSAAQRWLEFLWQSGRGRTSVQVLNEFYVNATAKLPRPLDRELAREDVEDLQAWRPVVVNNPVVKRAWEVEDRFHFAWWDSLIVAAALESNCRWLLTEDLQDEQEIWGLTIISPFVQEPAGL